MRVTTKGQVTIPGPIRRKLGIKPGDSVEFAEEGGQIVLLKTPDAREDVERFAAALRRFEGSARGGPFKTADEALDFLRGRDRRD